MTALDVDGGSAALTVNSFASGSLDPALILSSLRSDGRNIPVFQVSPGFVVNVLAADQAKLSSRFAGRNEDKWTNVAQAPGIYGIATCGAHAILECEKKAPLRRRSPRLCGSRGYDNNRRGCKSLSIVVDTAMSPQESADFNLSKRCEPYSCSTFPAGCFE